ncbi:MAG: hypothetical protein J5582_13875 [Ruminococcus sp.]|uniref:hypothetical protein n=1 Tax=Ruminococcus sp. TaxID=41978 RepID=UPI0025D1A5C4|nr:hypothetical protein [Ruminococcus sp.]MBO4867626.1 hypothetical protein [Ruminococcus sp.]
MKKKKAIIIALCVVIVVLVRIFTPYLGKPFLIYCHCEKGKETREDFYLSSKVNKVVIFSSDDPCIKFLRYCSGLEEIEIIGSFSKAIDLNDIASPSLIKFDNAGKCVNWSGLNRCTELKHLHTYESDFKTTADISGLKNLETLQIIETEISLDKLNELKSLKSLTLLCSMEINCEDLSELDKLETLNLGRNESMYNKNTRLKNTDQLNKLKNLKELNIRCQNDINCEDFAQLENLEVLSLESDGKITGLDSVGMDNLIRINIPITKLTNEAKKKLKEKGVFINYK